MHYWKWTFFRSGFIQFIIHKWMSVLKTIKALSEKVFLHLLILFYCHAFTLHVHVAAKLITWVGIVDGVAIKVYLHEGHGFGENDVQYLYHDKRVIVTGSTYRYIATHGCILRFFFFISSVCLPQKYFITVAINFIFCMNIAHIHNSCIRSQISCFKFLPIGVANFFYVCQEYIHVCMSLAVAGLLNELFAGLVNAVSWVFCATFKLTNSCLK